MAVPGESMAVGGVSRLCAHCSAQYGQCVAVAVGPAVVVVVGRVIEAQTTVAPKAPPRRA